VSEFESSATAFIFCQFSVVCLICINLLVCLAIILFLYFNLFSWFDEADADAERKSATSVRVFQAA
jgi:hypothetical protein